MSGLPVALAKGKTAIELTGECCGRRRKSAAAIISPRTTAAVRMATALCFHQTRGGAMAVAMATEADRLDSFPLFRRFRSAWSSAAV
jgi:hypothetical protein